MKMKYKVVVKTLPQDSPKDFEMSAALIIAEYFQADVEFLRTGHMKTPDLLIRGRIWELKSPRGNSKNTIRNNIKTARKQSENIIIDLRRCKLREMKSISRIKDVYLKRRRKSGTYLIICKNGRVVDIRDVI